MTSFIVSGATGFIGSHLVELLVAEGHQVLALGRKQRDELTGTRREKLHGATYLSLNMDDIATLPEFMEDVDWRQSGPSVFINLAWGGSEKLSDMSPNGQLRNVVRSVEALEAAMTIGCDRFLQVGTMEEAFMDQYLHLEHSRDSFFNRHVVYSCAKLAAFRALTIRAAQLGIGLLYVKQSHVLGRDDDKDSFLQVTLERMMSGEELIFSSGEQLFDVFSVHDCVRGYLAVAERGTPGKSYWLGSGTPRQLREYVERMHVLFPTAAQMQFGKLPYNDIRLDEAVFSTEELRRDTGFVPSIGFEEAILDLAHYLKGQGSF